MDFFSWASSFFDEQEKPKSGNRGPLGGETNQPVVDPGTLTRTASRPPALVLDPIQLWYVKPALDLEKRELKEYIKKFEVGEDVYDGLGLAGQIAKKFLKLSYRSGKLVRKGDEYKVLDQKTAQKRVGGVVCSSFINLFGAIYFAENPTKPPAPVKAISESVRAIVRDSTPDEIAAGSKKYKIVSKSDGTVLGESNDKLKATERARLRTAAAVGNKNPETGEKKKYSLSAPQIYASDHGGSLVNTIRLRRDSLIEELNNLPGSKEHLYAVVKYDKKSIKTGSKGHVFLLVYSKVIDDWVTIESTGWGRESGGTGAGPGIYRIPRVENEKHPRFGKIRRGNWYQAFDWGVLKPRNNNFNDWEYIS